jgi:hypothetical protein
MTGIETKVTVSPQPVQVPEGPEGLQAIVVQLWVRSDAGSWSGCLSSRGAEDLARLLAAAARDARERNGRANGESDVPTRPRGLRRAA